MASKEIREALSAPFPPSEVYQRQGPGGKKFDYIAGETVIRRLMSATADQVYGGQEQGYAWNSRIVKIEKDNDGPWVAIVEGQLLIGGDMGTGVGAMSNSDPDMAVKSANTEALKNAAKNGFGIGLELWDAEYRATLDQRRRAAGGSEQALKALVFDIAKTKLGAAKPSQADIAKVFGVEPGDLSDPEKLTQILEEEGVL